MAPPTATAVVAGVVCLLARRADAGSVVALAGGYSHSLFLKESGRLFGAGNNMYGELVDNTTRKLLKPIRMVDGVQAVAAGYYHSLMLTNDSRVVAAGDNSDGQLGVGTNEDVWAPMQVMKQVQAIAAGGSHSLFLTNAGSVYAAGYNAFGQLADGSTRDRNRPKMVRSLPEHFDVISMAAGTMHSLFLSKKGDVAAAGNNDNGQLGSSSKRTTNTQPVDVELPGKAAQISAGSFHSLFLLTDGRVFSSGQNKDGQLGDGTFEDRHTPVEMLGVKKAIEIAGGFQHSLVLQQGGRVWNVGDNKHGQLADGTARGRSRAARVETLTGVTDIASGALHSLFVVKDGTVLTSGSNFWGQLGDNSGDDQLAPVNALVPWKLSKKEDEWINRFGRRFETFRGLHHSDGAGQGTAVLAFAAGSAFGSAILFGAYRFARKLRSPLAPFDADAAGAATAALICDELS